MARTARRKDPKALIHEVFSGESAHMSLQEAVAAFPVAQINTKPPNVPYSFWHILEHIRIAQTDLLDYVQKSKHVSPTWPEGYWPAPVAPTAVAGGKRTIAPIKADLTRLEGMLADPSVDVLPPAAV